MYGLLSVWNFGWLLYFPFCEMYFRKPDELGCADFRFDILLASLIWAVFSIGIQIFLIYKRKFYSVVGTLIFTTLLVMVFILKLDLGKYTLGIFGIFGAILSLWFIIYIISTNTKIISK
jgi:hypothetical protein